MRSHQATTISLVLGLMASSCTSSDSSGASTTLAATAPTQPGQAASAAGTDLEVLTTESGATELVAKAGMHRLLRVCDEVACPDNLHFELRSYVLIDFQHLYALGPIRATVSNQVDAAEWWEFPIEAEIPPGEHCVVTINRWLPLDPLSGPAEGVTGRLDMVGTASDGTHCTTDHLQLFDGALRTMEVGSCSGMPILTLVSDGNSVDDDEVFVNVPACNDEQVLVQIRNGELNLDLLRRLPASDDRGLYVSVQDRPSDGTLRLLTVRLPATGRDTSFAVITSPPARFPVGSG